MLLLTRHRKAGQIWLQELKVSWDDIEEAHVCGKDILHTGFQHLAGIRMKDKERLASRGTERTAWHVIQLPWSPHSSGSPSRLQRAPGKFKWNLYICLCLWQENLIFRCLWTRDIDLELSWKIKRNSNKEGETKLNKCTWATDAEAKGWESIDSNTSDEGLPRSYIYQAWQKRRHYQINPVHVLYVLCYSVVPSPARLFSGSDCMVPDLSYPGTFEIPVRTHPEKVKGMKRWIDQAEGVSE